MFNYKQYKLFNYKKYSLWLTKHLVYKLKEVTLTLVRTLFTRAEFVTTERSINLTFYNKRIKKG